MEDVYAQSKCRVHAVRLRVHSVSKNRPTSTSFKNICRRSFASCGHLSISGAILCCGAPFGTVAVAVEAIVCVPPCSFFPVFGSGSILQSQRICPKSHSSAFSSSRCPPTCVELETTSSSSRYYPPNFFFTIKSIMICRSFGSDHVFLQVVIKCGICPHNPRISQS